MFTCQSGKRTVYIRLYDDQLRWRTSLIALWMLKRPPFSICDSTFRIMCQIINKRKDYASVIPIWNIIGESDYFDYEVYSFLLSILVLAILEECGQPFWQLGISLEMFLKLWDDAAIRRTLIAAIHPWEEDLEFLKRHPDAFSEQHGELVIRRGSAWSPLSINRILLLATDREFMLRLLSQYGHLVQRTWPEVYPRILDWLRVTEEEFLLLSL